MGGTDPKVEPRPVGQGARAYAVPPQVLRIYRFRPLDVAFDRTMREIILPELRSRPGALDVYAGRKGPGETGVRTVVSLWATDEQMTAAMGPDLDRLRFFPEYMLQTTDHELEVLPVRFAMGGQASAEVGILRIARGELAAASMSDYADQMRTGVEADIRNGHGPTRMALGASGERHFVSVSCWLDWPTIERATGASVQQPIHTKGLADLRTFSVDHLELVPIAG